MVVLQEKAELVKALLDADARGVTGVSFPVAPMAPLPPTYNPPTAGPVVAFQPVAFSPPILQWAPTLEPVAPVASIPQAPTLSPARTDISPCGDCAHPTASGMAAVAGGGPPSPSATQISATNRKDISGIQIFGIFLTIIAILLTLYHAGRN